MASASPPKRRKLGVIRRPEGGLGETRPVVVSPSGSSGGDREIATKLHELVEALVARSIVDRTTEPSPGSSAPLLLSAVEAGRLLSISRAKVLDLAARGEIPSLRIGGSVRIPRDSLETWIAARTKAMSPTSIPLPEWARRWSNES